MSVGRFKYSCIGCHRTYTWKQKEAGRRGKCKCGQYVTVPLQLPQAESENALFAFAGSASGVKVAVAERPRISVPITRISVRTPAYVAAEAIENVEIHEDAQSVDRGNSGQFLFSKLTDPMRDLFVPLALFAMGLLGALAWVLAGSRLGTSGLVATSFLVGMVTSIKTAALIGLAFIFAPRLGISFGLLGPAILKFAAVIVFVDSSELWLNLSLNAAEGKSPFFYLSVIRLGAAAILISTTCFYLFQMDLTELAMFAVPMAFVSWVIDVVLGLMILTLVVAPTNSNPSTAVSIASPAIVTSQVLANIDLTKTDRAILQRIHQRSSLPLVSEGNEWKQQYSAADNRISLLIDRLYSAGADRVYIDIIGVAYVQLPSDNAEKRACLDLANGYLDENATSFRSQIHLPQGKFMVILLHH